MLKCLFSVFFALSCNLALAQGYPNKPIRFIVPYPPGGGTDTAARPIAQKMSEITGQPVVVENKAGGTSIIGTEILAKSRPDGYTMVIIDDTFAINATLFPKLPYDSNRDFIPVTGILRTPLMLVVPPQFAANTLTEFVAMAKAKPGELNYASLGATGVQALSMEWFTHLAGIKVTAIPYKGLAPAMLAVTTNETQALVAGLTAGMAQVQGGKLKALAVTSAKRVGVLPNVPSIGESYPEYDITPWYGILVPAETPLEVVAKLNAVITEALNSPEIRQRFSPTGVEVWPTSPDEFAAFLRKNREMWAGIIKTTGVKAE